MSDIKVFKTTTDFEKKCSLLANTRACFDANIGAGKSTLCLSLERYLNRLGVKVELSIEDIDNKSKTLELFLNDMKKYAFAFQLMMLSERLNIYYLSAPELSNGRTHIIDRSLVGDYAFAWLHRVKDNISEKEWDAYLQMLQKFKDNDFFKTPEYYIYLDVKPEKIMERISRRNRGSEQSAYSLEYIQAIDMAHRKALGDLGINYINIDWNEDHSLDNEGLLPDEICEKVLNTILNARLTELETIR